MKRLRQCETRLNIDFMMMFHSFVSIFAAVHMYGYDKWAQFIDSDRNRDRSKNNYKDYSPKSVFY